MNIFPSVRSSLVKFFSKKIDLNIKVNYNIPIGLQLTYYCKLVHDHFWFELIQIENYRDESNDAKIVLPFPKYNGNNTIRGGKSREIFYLLFGKKIELKMVCYAPQLT
jgi:hypothetical protein